MFNFIGRLMGKHTKLYQDGAYLMRKGKYVDALKALDEAIKINPSYYSAYLLRGELHYCFYGLAEIDYKNVYKDKEGYQKLCLDRASGDLSKYLVALPGVPYALMLMGMVYSARKDNKKALDCYEAAEKRQNELSEASRTALRGYLEKMRKV